MTGMGLATHGLHLIAMAAKHDRPAPTAVTKVQARKNGADNKLTKIFSYQTFAGYLYD